MLALSLASAPACASDIELFSPDTVAASADVRAVATDAEASWTTGGFGKSRYGDEAGVRLGNADLVWQPRFGWAVTATIAATAQSGPRAEAGISEAYLTIKPQVSGTLRFSARAGFLWPAVSLEHKGADWHVADTITPSAINSWIGEEVRPLAAEANAGFSLAGTRVTAAAALFTANDTAGTLLALRGWALHDRKTLLGHSQPLPVLSRLVSKIQPRYTHPTIYLGEGFAKKPGYYVKLGWSPVAMMLLEVFHYDNRADPEDVNAELEWGWRTRFDQLAATFQLDPATTFKAQALRGRSLMGFPNAAGRIWVDSHFQSAFGLLSHAFASGGLAFRAEAFSTRQDGSFNTADDGERGWATTLAAHRDLRRGLSFWVEALHIDSRRAARRREGLDPVQHQNQLQFVLRGRW